MDSIDRKIADILQRNGRIPNSELAEKVDLSPTPCLRRVKRMEAAGIIKGYRAELAPQAVGINVSAVVFVQLTRNSTENAKEFEKEIDALVKVQDCFVLTGKHDYMIRVVAKDLGDYERFIKDKLANVPHVKTLESTIILNQVKSRPFLPIS